MVVQNFPFVFDAEKLKELFNVAKLSGVDADAVLAAQQKNVDAMIEASAIHTLIRQRLPTPSCRGHSPYCGKASEPGR